MRSPSASIRVSSSSRLRVAIACRSSPPGEGPLQAPRLKFPRRRSREQYEARTGPMLSPAPGDRYVHAGRILDLDRRGSAQLNAPGSMEEIQNVTAAGKEKDRRSAMNAGAFRRSK